MGLAIAIESFMQIALVVSCTLCIDHKSLWILGHGSPNIWFDGDTVHPFFPRHACQIEITLSLDNIHIMSIHSKT